MARKKQYDKGYEAGEQAGRLAALKEARDILNEQADEIKARNDELQAAQDELMAELRVIDAELWGAVDTFSRDWTKWLTRDRDDIPALRAQSRIATGVTISYDDGYVWHSARRIGGLTMKPAILHFEHSDPAHVGTVHEAVHYNAAEMVLKPTEENEDG